MLMLEQKLAQEEAAPAAEALPASAKAKRKAALARAEAKEAITEDVFAAPAASVKTERVVDRDVASSRGPERAVTPGPATPPPLAAAPGKVGCCNESLGRLACCMHLPSRAHWVPSPIADMLEACNCCGLAFRPAGI